MSSEASPLKKATVLTGLTVLMGGAEVSRAEASQLLPLPSSVSQTVASGQSSNGVTTELDFNQFNGSGTLTGVEFNLSSTIEQITNGGSIFFPSPDTRTATVSVNNQQLDSFTLTGSGSSSFHFDVTDNLVFANASFYSGSGTFPVGLQISGFNCVEPFTAPSCSINWTGTLTVTFDTTATPLPASLPLLGTGLAALGLAAWRGRRKQKPAT